MSSYVINSYETMIQAKQVILVAHGFIKGERYAYARVDGKEYGVAPAWFIEDAQGAFERAVLRKEKRNES